jgi:hypothetical protein
VEVDLWIIAAETRDISLKAGLIEPAEHQIKLFAQNEPDERQGELLEFHWLVQNSAKNLGGLGIRQLASRNLKLPSDEFFGALESKGRKSSNIVGCDRLVGLVRADGVSQLAFEDSDFDLISSMPRLWAQMPRRALANGWLAVTKVI